MQTKPAYLVIALRERGRAVIKRSTQSWPALEAGEAVVRITLELPDSVFEHPIVTVTVEPEDVAVAVVEPVEEHRLFPEDRSSETGGGVGA